MNELLRQACVLMYALGNRAINNRQDTDFCMNVLLTEVANTKRMPMNMEQEYCESLNKVVRDIKQRIKLDGRWDVENEKFFS